MAKVVFYSFIVGEDDPKVRRYSFSCLQIPPQSPNKEVTGPAAQIIDTAFNDWLESLEELGHEVEWKNCWWEISEDEDDE